MRGRTSKVLEGAGDRRELKKTRMVIHKLEEQIPDLPSDTNYQDTPEEQKRDIIHLLNRISAQLEKGQGDTYLYWWMGSLSSWMGWREMRCTNSFVQSLHVRMSC